MLPARHRLRDRRDFAIAVRGRRVGNRLVVVHAARPDARADQPARIGLAVSRAVGNAVVRNRAKRVLRARLAAMMPSIPPGTDLVVRAQPQLRRATGDEVDAALESALRRAVAAVGCSRER